MTQIMLGSADMYVLGSCVTCVCGRMLSAGLLFLAVIDKCDVIFCSVHVPFDDNIQLIILLEHAVKRATHTSCDVIHVAWFTRDPPIASVER